MEGLYNSREEVIALAENAGFKLAKEIIIKDPCQKKELFNNPEIFLKKEGRDQDSVWSLYSEEEVKESIALLEDLIKNNSFKEWAWEHGGKEAEEIGYSTHFVFLKK